MDRPSIRQLECLVAVADHRSFRKAATALGISQPALSAQVAGRRAAARRPGVRARSPLRCWSRPRARTSSVARALALDAIDAVGDAARRRAEPLVGPLRLGVIPTIAPYWLPALLPAVRKRFPRLELILREDQTARLLAQLGAGQIDVAFLALPVPGDVTTARDRARGASSSRPRAARRSLHRRGKLTERDLEDQTVLLLEDGHCLRDQALAVCERGGAVESMEVRATSLPTLVQMVAGGLGITLLPEAAAEALVQPRGPVEVAALGKPPPGRTIGLAWRTSSARLREFRLLAEVMSEAADTFLAQLRKRGPRN